ncbi:MAG: transcriptional regulator GcvA [Pseudomonadota bacterium]
MPYSLPPLNGLRAFEATARHMSFTLAAEELHVTPAALSYQVRQLEEILGLKLFRRMNRAIELTNHGETLFPGIRAGFERMDEAMRRLRRRADTNVLVVSVGPAFAAKWLAPRLYRFIQKHPDIDPRISANIQISDFENEHIDLAVRFGAGHYPELYSELLVEEHVTPMCSPDLVSDSHPRPLRVPDDLRHHSLIHDESLSFFRDAPNWQTWCNEEGVKGIDYDSGVHFTIADHGLDAAVEGAGVVLGRHVLSHFDRRSGRLICPFARKLDSDYSFYIVSPMSTKDDRKVVAFREWLHEEAARDRAENARFAEPDGTSAG